jgi:hypothetical protein
MNIILDMDETLICSRFSENNYFAQPIPRPYLTNFFHFVFNKFERVSIWTHGTKEWYEIVYNKIFKYIIPPGKKFHFVRTRDDVYNYKDFIEPNIINTFVFRYIKPLQLIYKTYPDDYNEKNTYILDDNPMTYIMNQKNAIAIKSYNKYTNGDIELIIIMNLIDYKMKYSKLGGNKEINIII